MRQFSINEIRKRLEGRTDKQLICFMQRFRKGERPIFAPEYGITEKGQNETVYEMIQEILQIRYDVDEISRLLIESRNEALEVIIERISAGILLKNYPEHIRAELIKMARTLSERDVTGEKSLEDLEMEITQIEKRAIKNVSHEPDIGM